MLPDPQFPKKDEDFADLANLGFAKICECEDQSDPFIEFLKMLQYAAAFSLQRYKILWLII